MLTKQRIIQFSNGKYALQVYRPSLNFYFFKTKEKIVGYKSKYTGYIKKREDIVAIETYCLVDTLTELNNKYFYLTYKIIADVEDTNA